jgi:hypothetical protein
MSIELMNAVWRADLGTVPYIIPATDKRAETTGYLDATDKYVLVALANHANPDGRSIYPSVERLAKTMGSSERTVQRSLLHLMHTIPRILAVEKEASRYSTRHYRILVPALKRVRQWKLRKDEPGLTDGRPGVTHGRPGKTNGHLSAAGGDTRSVRGDQLTPDSPVEPSTSKANHQLEPSEDPLKSNTARSDGARHGKLHGIISDKLWDAIPKEVRRGEGSRREFFREVADLEVTPEEANAVVWDIPSSDFFDYEGQPLDTPAEWLVEQISRLRREVAEVSTE